MSQRLSLDLNKSTAAFRLSLDKAGVAPDIKAELVVIMDVSQSFEHEHKEGTTSVLLERFVPLAKVLDPDGKIDLITFSDGPDSVQYLGEIDESNARNYIIDNVVKRVRGWNGGTTYSYALQEALRVFGWLPYGAGSAPERKPRFWERLFGLTPEERATPRPGCEKKRSIVLFVTDGENDPTSRHGDKRHTREVLRASQERGDQVYFLFIGACEHEEFDFVEAIAKEFKNTGIVMATDPEAFVELPDDELIAKLLG
ncbi:MAG: VWA domain-containing protein, partial [Tahibacter sp.]